MASQNTSQSSLAAPSAGGTDSMALRMRAGMASLMPSLIERYLS